MSLFFVPSPFKIAERQYSVSRVIKASPGGYMLRDLESDGDSFI